MAYLSDRQRVELLLLPLIAQGVVQHGADDINSPTAQTAVGAFGEAMREVVTGVPPKKRDTLVRRALRIHNDVTRTHRQAGARVDKVGLMLYYLLRWATDGGYLVLHDGSHMAKGLDLLLPALEHAANVSKLDTSARKAAAKMLKALQAEGLFEGVQPIEDIVT